MNNVTPITKNAGRRITSVGIGALANELRNDLRKPEVVSARREERRNELLLEDLEAASSEHLLKLLQLAHERERFEREQGAALGEANAELEHAAYFTHMAGLSEEAIYEISDRTADALSAAMKKVQETA